MNGASVSRYGICVYVYMCIYMYYVRIRVRIRIRIRMRIRVRIDVYSGVLGGCIGIGGERRGFVGYAER